MKRGGIERVGRTDLPPEQRRALRSAIRWEWFTIGYTVVTIALIAFVVGGSQAMKTAWIEDMLSLIPQIAFLIALLFIRRPPSRSFPFGLHRVMGVGHLVAGVALLAVGGSLAVESAIGLIRAEHPAIGTVRIWGQTVWLGWFMVAVMSVIVIGPFIYGHAKSKLAPVLHNKVLYADADMAKADWTTTVASIVGVLGVGVGLWWLDGAAAIFISLGIIWDGYRNARAAIFDLIDQRARTHDDAREDPLGERIVRRVRRERWVRDGGVRMRDMGQVFHVEVFVVPRRRFVTVRRIETLKRTVVVLDWRMQDVSIVVVASLPEEIRDRS
ncbi:cation transporter [Microbacterium dauci]|uniref:Cation transporter n=1 Tax=Microbacterium dauci TaxID=3048008 RepID=A0ABT6ZF24_9MICO|nr:cation transporter [Microbacterium sp. LX3-4]MDJ1114759.1 cation transporter [Microbacterium sp. LX3-4]